MGNFTDRYGFQIKMHGMWTPDHDPRKQVEKNIKQAKKPEMDKRLRHIDKWKGMNNGLYFDRLRRNNYKP